MTARKIKTAKSTTAKVAMKPRTSNVSVDLGSLRKSIQKGMKTPVYIVAGQSKIRIPMEKLSMVIEAIENKSESGGEVLTTQEVADLLNVSRPFVIKLIDNKELPLEFMAGNQRRILKSAVLEYRDRMRRKQNEALDALTKQSEDLEMDF
ncbi:helix-turn-helix domain-containing protein [Bdellovibrio sp.]|uniref:helix-turn-helix domain-containing protein n=1 Tax=Bdellovibrio sp. TaxID=28201 RepID=UPI0039E2E36E